MSKNDTRRCDWCSMRLAEDELDVMHLECAREAERYEMETEAISDEAERLERSIVFHTPSVWIGGFFSS